MSEQDQPIHDETDEQEDPRRANTGDIKPPQRIAPTEPAAPGEERTEGGREGTGE